MNYLILKLEMGKPRYSIILIKNLILLISFLRIIITTTASVYIYSETTANKTEGEIKIHAKLMQQLWDLIFILR